MLSANFAKAHGHLKASAPSKLYGEAAITHSADGCGDTRVARGAHPLAGEFLLAVHAWWNVTMVGTGLRNWLDGLGMPAGR